MLFDCDRSNILACIVWLKRILVKSIDTFTIHHAFTEEKGKSDSETSQVRDGVEKEEEGVDDDDDVDWFFEDAHEDIPSPSPTRDVCDGKDKDKEKCSFASISPIPSQRIWKNMHREEMACDVTLQAFDMMSIHKVGFRITPLSTAIAPHPFLSTTLLNADLLQNHRNLDAEHIISLGIAGMSTRNSCAIFGFAIPLNRSHWASWCDFCNDGDKFVMNKIGFILLERIFDDDLDVIKSVDQYSGAIVAAIHSSTELVASMDIRMIVTHESISKHHRALIMKLWNTFVVSEVPMSEMKRLELASGVPTLPCIPCASRDEVRVVNVRALLL
jgi:hypothetical protein